MPDIRDLRRKARLSLHGAMKVPAIYIDPDDESETPCFVRVHHRTKAFGDMTGFDFAPAERVETVPEIVSLTAEVSPSRGGVFSIATGEAYAVEVVMPPDDITETSQVTRLSASKAVGLPVPV